MHFAAFLLFRDVLFFFEVVNLVDDFFLEIGENDGQLENENESTFKFITSSSGFYLAYS